MIIPLLGLLFSFVLSLTFYAQPSADRHSDADIRSMIDAFEKASGKDRIVMANKFFDLLEKEQFSDTLIQFGTSESLDHVNMHTWIWIASYMGSEQDHNACIEWAMKAMPLVENSEDKELKADYYHLLGVNYFYLSDYAKALEYTQESMGVEWDMNDLNRVGSSLNTMAAICLASGQASEGLVYINEGMKFSEQTGDSLLLATQNGIASELYLKKKDFSKSLACAQYAYFLDSCLNLPDRMGVRLLQKAQILVRMEKYSEAQPVLQRSIKIHREYNDRKSLGVSYNLMGDVMLSLGNKAEAANYFSQALEIFKQKSDLYSQSYAQWGLFKAYRESNPSKAIEHLLQQTELKDSIFNKQQSEQLSEFNAKYQSEHLKYENETQRQRNESTTKMLYITGALVPLLLLLLICLLYMHYKQRKMQKELQATKDTFFTNVAHDFRTPLSIIISAATEINKAVPEESTVAHDANNIQRHAGTLLSLVNNILEISRLKSIKEMKFNWVHKDVTCFIGMLIDSYTKYTQRKGIELVYVTYNKPINMDYVADLLQKIVQNLVSNAVRYSTPGTTVTVETSIEEQCLCLQVRDQGVGMTDEQINHIFDAFYRVKNTTSIPGSGVGLSLVKMLVGELKGNISVTSAVGQGSTFKVLIPLVNSNPKIVASEDADTTEQTDIKKLNAQPLEMTKDNYTEDSEDDQASENNVRILIVEDTPDVAEYMARELPADYKCYFAFNGASGFKKAEELVPDVIITDVMMPGIDGYTFCEQIKASSLLNHIPVIMVTAKATHEDRIKGLQAGASVYIEKPFYPDELNAHIEQLMERRRLLRDKFMHYISDEKRPTEIVEQQTTSDATQQATPEAGAPAETVVISNADKVFLEKLQSLIMVRLGERPIDLNEIASTFNISRVQLNRKTKAITGLTTSACVTDIRVKKAKQLFDSGQELTVYEVSSLCGIEDASYFTAMFRKSTGMTPLQYVNRNKTA